MSVELIIAAVGIAGSIAGALIAARAQGRKTATEMYTQLCEAQQKRLDQLTRRIEDLETENDKLRVENARIPALEGEVQRLKARVAELEGCR